MGRPSKGIAEVTKPASAHTLEGLLELNGQLQQLLAESLREREDWLEERRRWTEERAWLRAMIDQVPDYLFAKDPQCRFVIANKAVAADLGRDDPNGILGKTDLELHPPELARRFIENDRTVLQTGEPILDSEEYVVRPSGQRRWLSTSKLPLRNADGVVIGLVGIARDITERKKAEDQVRLLAYYDPLTALPNRASFELQLDQVAQSHASDAEDRLILVDLDRFKQVNDTLGHAAGDELLRSVAGRLSRLVQKHGTVFRLGGDEFVVVASFDSSDDPKDFYDALVDGLGSAFDVMGNSIHVGASMGVAAIHHATTPLSALREADIALYEAKAKGRNRWQLFEPRMAEFLERRHQLEEDLRRALVSGEQIVVLYQPVYDNSGTAIVGAEALVRWQHPTLGTLSPDQFILVAEERSLIADLGNIVLRRACELLSRTDLPWVAVNVSPIQLRDPNFAQVLLGTVATYGIETSRLQIEVTEGVLLDDLGVAKVLLDRLRWAGVRVALDDFGTGYSSLSYLGRFAVDKIKVDRSFVARIGTASANAIVEAVLAFAGALHMTVTAEGVETEEQRLFLKSIGCQELQGYLLSRPITDDDLDQLLIRSKAIPAPIDTTG